MRSRPDAEPRSEVALHLIDQGDALADAVESELRASGADPVHRRTLREPDGEPGFEPAAQGAVVLLPARPSPDLRDSAQRAAVSCFVRAAASAAAAGARRVILVSSAEIYEPSHRHPGHLNEERLRVRQLKNTVARFWLELENQVQHELNHQPMRGQEKGTELIILRPTALALKGGQDAWSRLLSGAVRAVPLGFDPPVQWLSVRQLVHAVVAAGRPQGLAGRRPTKVLSLNVAPPTVTPLRAALRRAGVRALPLPSFLLRALYRLRGRCPDRVDYLRYPWTVSSHALQGLLHGNHGSPQPTSRAVAPPPAMDQADPFGMDRDYVDRLGKSLFRFLHDVYWRVEWRGLEHLPRESGAVLTGVHRGHQPWDGIMVLHRLARSLGRYPRFLIHPTLVKHPFLAPYMIRCGGIHACRENGDWVLESDELLAIFPEGIRGAFSMYRDAQELKKFGRHDFVKFALRHRKPIVPFVVLGSAEIFPIFHKVRWPWWQKVSEWPCLPITPTLSTVPLPSKWHVLFLPPIHLPQGPEAADDHALVRAISDRVRQQMQFALDHLASRRKHIFHGSIFDQPDWPVDAADRSSAPQTTEAPA